MPNPNPPAPQPTPPAYPAPPPSQPMQHPATPRNNIFSNASALARFLRARNELTPRQQTAIELLLQGLSDHQAAAQLGIDRTTVFRWRKSPAFARELDRQRHLLWEQSVAQLQSMVQPALNILRKQLASPDEKASLRAAATLLRFATPSRLLAPSAAEDLRNATTQHDDDIDAYINAPMPGHPGAPEDLPTDPTDADD